MADNSTDDMIIAIGVDLATIRRGLKKLEQEVGTSTGRVQKQFESVGRGIDSAMTTAMQNRINAMVGVGTKGAKEWTGALADQGKELERLRAKYSPLFATINNYKAAQADIRTLYRSGKIGAEEYTSALSQQRQEALKSIATIKARNAALSDTPNVRGGMAGRANTANIAAQFQDIAVTSAMGMSPLQIALQQGTQLSAVLGTMGSGRQVIAGLGAAFASLVSPVSLVTIGLIAGGAALAQYIFSSKDVKSADDILKGHAETIALLKDRYGDAAKGLQEYARESTQVAKADLDERLKDARKFVAEQAKITASFGPGLLTGFAATLKDMDPTVVRDLRVAFADLSASVARGEPDILRFREALSRIANNEAVPESIRKMAEEYRKFDDETLKVAKSIPSMLEQLKLIEGVANGQTDAINKLAGAMRDLNKIGVAPLTDLQEAEKLWQDARRNAKNREERDDADMAYRKAVERIANANPTINNADGKRVAVPVPGDKPSPLDGDGKELKKQETAAEKLKRKYEDLIATARERNDELRLEIDLVGQAGNASEAARNALELYQRAKRAGIEGDNLEAIKAEAKTYRELADTLAQVKLQQDLINQARFSSLSKQDQQVVTTLRQYGLSEDLNGKNAQAIRQSLQGQEISDGFKSFAMQFSTGLISEGKSLGEAFGDAVKTAAASAMQKSLESLFSQIGNALASALMPKLGGGASDSAFSATTTLGDLLGAGAAKTGDVGSAPTTDIAAYIKQAAIKRGIDPDIALKVAKSEGGVDSWNLQSNFVKNGVREQSYGPFQLYKGGGLGNEFMDKTGLDPALAANGPAGVDFAMDHVSKKGWGAWYGAKKVGVGDWEGIDTSAKAVEKLGTAATDTAKMTAGLGQTLASIPQALMANGGGSGIMSSLTKYGMGLFAQSPQFASAWLSGGVGLYAGGGSVSGPGGPRTDSIPALLSNGEFVINASQTKKHRALLEAINSGRAVARYADGGLVSPAIVTAPRAPRLAASNANRMVRNESALTIQIQGANGDDHVRMLVKQGVNEALAGQNEQMRRGGFGSVQASYQTDKG